MDDLPKRTSICVIVICCFVAHGFGLGRRWPHDSTPYSPLRSTLQNRVKERDTPEHVETELATVTSFRRHALEYGQKRWLFRGRQGSRERLRPVAHHCGARSRPQGKPKRR